MKTVHCQLTLNPLETHFHWNLMLGPILLYYYSVSSANSLFPLTSDKARKLGVTVKQAESDAWFKALEKKNSQHQTFT